MGNTHWVKCMFTCLPITYVKISMLSNSPACPRRSSPKKHLLKLGGFLRGVPSLPSHHQISIHPAAICKRIALGFSGNKTFRVVRCQHVGLRSNVDIHERSPEGMVKLSPSIGSWNLDTLDNISKSPSNHPCVRDSRDTLKIWRASPSATWGLSLVWETTTHLRLSSKSGRSSKPYPKWALVLIDMIYW